MKSENVSGRRPIAARNSKLVGRFARWLAQKGVAPNLISQSSMVFAALAGLSFCFSGPVASSPPLIIAALLIQARLMANLLDGLVAVEGGMGTRDGAFWNEAPDRVADIFILTGAGFAMDLPSLGLLASCGALLTAYLRAMSVALVKEEDFSGPMAKQHRMAVMTVAALIGAVEAAYFGTHFALFLGLVIVVAGTVLTSLRRTRNLLRKLKKHQ
jgi:phosphatidylglycerophosphate synthase